MATVGLVLLGIACGDDDAVTDAGRADTGPRADAGPCACNPDLDGDGTIGSGDVSQLNSCMLPGAIGCDDADLNCDGELDRCDYEIIRCSFGTAPDPACCALRACGACNGAFEDGATCWRQAPETCTARMGAYQGDDTTCL
jgi:hypothetical protein